MSNPLPAHPARLAVAVIAHESEGLERTLASARSIGDQMVVVNPTASPQVAAIARAQGATVVDRPWRQDQAELRNAALEHVAADWVLWLEPAESLAAEAAAGLRHFVQTQANPKNVYLLVITVPPLPGEVGGEQIAEMRLIPGRAKLRYQGRLRERIEPSLEAQGLNREGLPYRILRPARETDLTIKQRRAKHILELADRELAERGLRPTILNERGAALGVLGDWINATRSFRQAAAIAPPQSSALREAYYGLVTGCGPLDRSALIDLCAQALEKFPLDAQLLCAMGGYLQAEQRLDLSAQAYRAAMEHGEIDPEVWHVPDIHEIAAICLCVTCQLRDDDDAARRVLEDMLSRRPDSPRVRHFLVEMHIRQKRRKEALAEIDRVPATAAEREALRSAVRGACLAVECDWTPALAYLQNAHRAGCRDLICLRWLAATLLASGQRAAALPILREWKLAEPRSLEAQKYILAVEEALAAEAAAAPSTASEPADEEIWTLRVDTRKAAGVPAPRGLQTPVAQRSESAPRH